MPFDLNALNELTIPCPFTYPRPPAPASIQETLRYKVAEAGKVIRYTVRTDDGTETILETVTHLDAVELTDAQRAEGIRVRREHVWEWLDRVHDGPLPICNGQSDNPTRLMTATEVHTTWPHLDALLEEMRQTIQEHHDPNLRALKMLRSP